MLQGVAEAYVYDPKCPIGDDETHEGSTHSFPGGEIAGGWFNYIKSQTIGGVYRHWYDLSYYVDRWGFAQCNCVSYAASQASRYVPAFNNSYKGQTWSHGYNWDDAARSAGIPVDNFPLPGDIAYWNTGGGGFGHVAWVDRVEYDANGNPTKVHLSEYNADYDHDYRNDREISPSSASGYIHLLAYNEGVTHLHYMNCYEMGNICNEQTPDEWLRIVQRVDNYRCTSCGGGDQVAIVNAFYDSIGFGGGGGDTTPIGTDPQPISGPRVDLRPDFDIKDIDGDELSSNCDNCETKPLRPNQEIKLVLTTQVSNEDAGNFKRDDDSNSIEGPIWYRMGEDDSWHKIVG